MNDSILPFGTKSAFPEKGLVHVSELIIYRHMLDTACLGGDRELLVSPDGMRKIHNLPTVQEASVAIQQIIANAQTNIMLEKVAQAENDLIDEEPETHFDLNDKVTKIVSSKGRQVNQMIQMINSMHVQQVLDGVVYQALDLQYPVIEEMDFSDIFSRLLEMSRGEGCEGEKKEILETLHFRIKDVSQRHLGGHWVEVKENPDLYEAIEAQLSIISNGFVFPENNA